MDKICIFCGNPLNEENKCINEHYVLNKKMCLNCEYLKNEDASVVCTNTVNMENARNKIIEAAKAAAGNYSIDGMVFELKPLPLKKPSVKCPQWELNNNIINSFVESFQ